MSTLVPLDEPLLKTDKLTSSAWVRFFQALANAGGYTPAVGTVLGTTSGTPTPGTWTLVGTQTIGATVVTYYRRTS